MIAAIILLSLLTRLINLNQSLWLDEAINVVAASRLSLAEFLTSYPVGDFHPPGYFLVIWLWGRLFDFSELVIRLPSVIFGVTTVYLVFRLGKKLFNQRVGLWAALLMAVAPLHVYYSQEARMYALAALAATFSWYLLVRLSDSWQTKIAYLVSLMLVWYSDYLAYLIIPAQIIYLVWADRGKLKPASLMLGLSVVALIPWWPVFLAQLKSGTQAAADLAGWASVVGGSGVKDLLLVAAKTFIGRVSIDDKTIYLGLMATLSVIYGWVLFKAIRRLDQSTKLLICWLIVPTAMALLISFKVPVLAYFRMLFILPAFYLLVAHGINSTGDRLIKPVTAVIVLVSIVSLFIYDTNSRFHRENWRGAVALTENLAKKDRAIIVLESNNLFAPFLYYSRTPDLTFAGLKNIPAKDRLDLANLEVITVDSSKEKIYLFEYLVDITDPQRLLETELKRLGYHNRQTYDFSGVGFVRLYQLE